LINKTIIIQPSNISQEVPTVKQFLITPVAGKRLIAKTLANHPAIKKALKNGTLVIVAGTTNGYVAEEIFRTQNISNDFSRKRFFRGITLPPTQPVTVEGRLADESKFPGDVIITKGVWQKGKTIADVVDALKEGDVILKGANALDLTHKQAAILIGHPKAGTIGLALPAVVGRRVRLIIPVGLEKRVNGDLQTLAEKLNAPGQGGYRLMPVVGEVFTEIEALKALTRAEVELIAAGGVCGAEGSYWLAVSGDEEQEAFAEKVVASIANEPTFNLDYL
jgi:6-phosphogluconate dehydrogenase (decarboxylating)